MNPDEAAEKVRAKLAAAHEETATLRERLAQADAALLAIAQAVGVVDEVDGRAPAPGPLEVIIDHIKQDQKERDAHQARAESLTRMLPLCSDHRDKQRGRDCLACEVERLTRERDAWQEDARLRAINTEDAQRDRDEAERRFRFADAMLADMTKERDQRERERDEARRQLDQERKAAQLRAVVSNAFATVAVEALESGAVPVTPRPDVPSVEEVRRCLTRLSEGPLYTWDSCIDGVQDTERTLRRLARACGLEVG